MGDRMTDQQLETSAELAVIALRHSLLSQISVISWLMVRLVASGAISREDAEHVLVETAQDLSLAGSEEPISVLHRLLSQPLVEHAKALRDAAQILP
jgi:hypothetical protein